ncbi:XkdS-like protein [Clostridioides difficile]|nr:XkdS-like protein [Clostridioides difficile]
MSTIFPFIGVPEDYILPKTEELPIFREVAWDFEKDEPILEKGDFKIIEKKEALKVWIYKCIKTNRYEHEIYSLEYGTELSELIGQKYTKGLTESEASRFIKEALLINPYILEVNVRSANFNRDILSANVKVSTIYGEVEINV